MNKNYYDLQQKICIVWRCIKKMACLIFWITQCLPRAEKTFLLPYADISGNIRVKSQFENVTSRQFSMKISILQGVNNVRFVKNAFFEMIHLQKSTLKNVHFIRFVWRAFSSGALRDSVTLPPEMMKSAIFKGFI